MKESIHTYFQIRTIQWISHPAYNILDSIKKIASDDYFDAIEVGRFADNETRKTTKDMLKQAYMKVCYGTQPHLLGPKLNPNDLGEVGRQKAEATLMEAVDKVEYLGATGIAFIRSITRMLMRSL